jgi:transcriptional regulator with XRE-family HTH domain
LSSSGNRLFFLGGLMHLDASEDRVGGSVDAKNFPARLRELRVKAGMTQGLLAKTLGLFQTTVSKYETGENQPSHEDLFAICAIFGVTPNDLFTEPRSVPKKRGRGRPKRAVESAPPSGGADTKKRSKSKRGAGGT